MYTSSKVTGQSSKSVFMATVSRRRISDSLALDTLGRVGPSGLDLTVIYEPDTPTGPGSAELRLSQLKYQFEKKIRRRELGTSR
ncbi:hypothetical protein PoB_002809600 [Plakobranchus ocellatus]|uniref:Uncharacterized protein n=1 Tax=Plakobranchus ocellatus TaxID=259542 RepID=A0AAV4A4M2_9GAST|nr:hypothetical protein PoB_002809600 [Plakobranchus ocellatus]